MLAARWPFSFFCSGLFFRCLVKRPVISSHFSQSCCAPWNRDCLRCLFWSSPDSHFIVFPHVLVSFVGSVCLLVKKAAASTKRCMGWACAKWRYAIKSVWRKMRGAHADLVASLEAQRGVSWHAIYEQPSHLRASGRSPPPLRKRSLYLFLFDLFCIILFAISGKHKVRVSEHLLPAIISHASKRLYAAAMHNYFYQLFLISTASWK